MKQYRNSERTKKWIRQAFIELIGEKKEIEKISIQELADRADITKTTFYYHFSDIYGVVEDLKMRLLINYRKHLKKFKIIIQVITLII